MPVKCLHKLSGTWFLVFLNELRKGECYIRRDDQYNLRVWVGFAKDKYGK